MREDDNLCRVAQMRLKSSFIYLANAVNDLRANWDVFAVVIVPLALLAALCLLPDAIKLQHQVARTFEGAGGTNISFTQHVQAHPDRPDAEQQASPMWFSFTLRPLFILIALITLVEKLVVLCALQRMHARARAPTLVGEGIEIFRRAIQLAPAFGLIVLFQWLAIGVGVVLLVVPGLLLYVWLYFAQYSLVFDDRHSWMALLFSRDLMRGRFFKVATRIVVFLAVWSGYNSWAATVFVVVSRLLGPVVYVTESVAATVFVIDLFAVLVSYATLAFFIAAGVRLYHDLSAIKAEEAQPQTDRQATTSLSTAPSQPAP